MTKLYVSSRFPREYHQGSIQELVRLQEEQANRLAEGSIIARHGALTAAPTTGNGVRGDLVDNSTPSVVASGIADYVIVGWICTASGTPGTWKERRVLIEDIAPSLLTNSLGADVALNNVANFFDGPSVAQGTAGTWWASGTITVVDTTGAAAIQAKLWDGTTVIASTVDVIDAINRRVTISLSGYLASPAGNIRISARDLDSTTGAILYNNSGTSKDSTLSVMRVA